MGKNKREEKTNGEIVNTGLRIDVLNPQAIYSQAVEYVRSGKSSLQGDPFVLDGCRFIDSVVNDVDISPSECNFRTGIKGSIARQIIPLFANGMQRGG